MHILNPPMLGAWHEAGDVFYHNHPDCLRGREIEPGRRMLGAEGRPLCEECRRRARQEQRASRFGVVMAR